MIPLRIQIVCRLALTVGSAAAFAPIFLSGQAVAPVQPPVPYFNRNVIVLDPAHGGQDQGGSIHGQPEKDVTLALATSLRAALVARGFTVVSTRDAELPEASPLLTPDQRAGIANHLRPVACLILHATNSGVGIHISTSSLAASAGPYESSATIRWESAQALYLPQSLRLANDLGLALVRAKLPVLLTRTTLRPLDNLTCPAIALEVAPLAGSGAKLLPASDLAYQRRIVEVLATATLTWRDLNAPRPTPPIPTPKPAPAIGATP